MPIGEAKTAMSAKTMALLAPDEPGAVVEYRTEGRSPFMLVCDHAGRRIPRTLHNLGLSEAEVARHIGWDIGIAGVGRTLADRLDACLVMQTYSRLVIDCNRPPGTPTSIAPMSESTAVPGNRNVSAHEAQLREREIFAPYHAAIEKHLDARAEAKRQTILISLHSFTPVYGGVARVWHAGVLYNRYNTLAASLLALLRASGESAFGDNEPYSVTDDTDYTIPVHGEKRGLPHVAIEIRQDLIAEEVGQLEWAESLAELLPKAAGISSPLP
jgi:predicted N-formylglutamate amidohydrolase